MYRPDPEVVAKAKQREAEYRAGWERCDSGIGVNEFLSFAGRVASGMAAGSGVTGLSREVWSLNGHSKVLPLDTEPNSPQMGASIGVNFVEVSQRSWFKMRTIAREVVSATVSIGPIAEDDGFPRHLASPDEVLRVFAHPPTVLYKNGESPLTIVDNNSEEMSRVKELIGVLYEGESQIADEHALPTGREVSGE